MAQFSVNQLRFDPYKNFKFRVKWDGRYVAGISKVSPLKRTAEVVEHREGGDALSPRKSPRLVKYEPVTLERGVTHDVEFEQWSLTTLREKLIKIGASALGATAAAIAVLLLKT